jgi:hypothetical protein
MTSSRPTLKEKLIADAEAHCARTGMSKARLATIVSKDGKFFTRIEAGGGCTIDMYERFQTFFDAAKAEASRPADADAEA